MALREWGRRGERADGVGPALPEGRGRGGAPTEPQAIPTLRSCPALPRRGLETPLGLELTPCSPGHHRRAIWEA